MEPPLSHGFTFAAFSPRSFVYWRLEKVLVGEGDLSCPEIHEYVIRLGHVRVFFHTPELNIALEPPSVFLILDCGLQQLHFEIVLVVFDALHDAQEGPLRWAIAFRGQGDLGSMDGWMAGIFLKPSPSRTVTGR
jgi:hypothetical protein